jgi:hypothetical protein
MKNELNPRDMQIADFLLQRKSHKDIAVQFNCSTKAIQRRLADPKFKAYMDKHRDETVADIRREQKKAIKVAVKTEKLEQKFAQDVAKLEGIKQELQPVGFVFTFFEAARRYLEIADTAKNEFCRLKAVDSLVALYAVAKGPQNVNPDEQDPDKPNVYRSQWLTQ